MCVPIKIIRERESMFVCLFTSFGEFLQNFNYTSSTLNFSVIYDKS